jgi:hypothetical protein
MQPLKSQLFARGGEIYEISDEYNASVSGFSGDYEYYGYLNVSGKWIIQQHQITTGAWRYVNGSASYSTAWTNKAILSGYDYYSAMFNTIP